MISRSSLVSLSLAISFAVFNPSVALSQPGVKSKSSKPAVTKKRKKRKSYKSGNYGATVNYGMWYIDTSYGAQGFYNWSRNLQLFGGVYSTKSNQNWKSSSERLTNKLEIDTETIGSGFRYFLTESLYLSGSLNYLYYTGTYEVQIDGADTASHEYDSVQYLGSLSIGNQWIFKNGITIGADWIGAGENISRRSNLELKEGEPDLISVGDLEEALDEQIDYHGPIVQLGYMF